MKTQRTRWSEEEKEQLRVMRDKKMIIKNMALEIGRSEYSVTNMLHKLGLTPRTRKRSLNIRVGRDKFDRDRYQESIRAIAAIEQALDSYVLTKGKQSHVHIS